MIAVDTSALLAIVLDEPAAEACMGVLENEPDLVMSSATLAEALIVASRRNVLGGVERLIDGLRIDVAPVTASTAHLVGVTYARWGKGQHPAALNFGDCFAYAVAREHDCPLLFVGDDFARTDITPAL